jgi:phage N-6-adenine-methyltransferase
MSSLAVHFSSASPDWRTPPAVLDRVIACLGAIDLDPCADPDRQVPAAAHFTAADDGLAHPWHGRVFMNPPYGRAVGRWVDKLLAEYAAGRVTAAVALVPARVDTRWFRRVAGHPVAFWRGRLRFHRPGGVPRPAPFPSALVALGVPADRFAAALADVADVWVAVPPDPADGACS